MKVPPSMDQETSKSPTDTHSIQFRPLSEGLGFHPFSDGLPYAPIAKNPRIDLSGAGAVAAGPARPVPPPRPQKVQVSSPSKPIPQISVPVAAASPAIATPQFTQPNSPQPHYRTQRVLAFLWDCLINFIFCCAVVATIVWKRAIDYDVFGSFGSLLIIVGAGALTHWVLLATQEMIFRTSLGKRTFRLTLNGSRPKVFLRSFLFIFSVGLFGIGLIWSLFDRKKRCLHDRLTDIQPYQT